MSGQDDHGGPGLSWRRIAVGERSHWHEDWWQESGDRMLEVETVDVLVSLARMLNM